MKIIVGFGNPEQKYNFTRHNFGFLFLDFYAKIHKLEFQSSPKFLADIAKQDTLLFVKPKTFYNEIGQSVLSLVNFYKLNPSEDLIVVCDDFNLPFGQIRYRKKGSSGGNNGLKSIEKYLNTTDFQRIRLGSENEALRKKIGDVDFVLSKFTPEERENLPEIMKNALETLKSNIS